MAELINACPFCDNSDLIKRKQDWKCKKCGAIFNEPVQRPMKRGGGPKFLKKRVTDNDSTSRMLTEKEAKIFETDADRAKKQVSREAQTAQWKAKRRERKIAASKARWHAKFDGGYNGNNRNLP